MDGNLSTGIGEVYIDYDVIAKFAGSAAVECFGIVGMAAVSMKDGLAKLLRRESLSHGVNVRVKDNKITIDMHVIVSYGISIEAVCTNLCENVKYRVEELSGLAVEKVNVYVEGVRVID
ncbi:MAG: Asp23/Gls24 family envelope stress response protein [Lachnospiraceae bacterium]|nr:Asp23/Gls24 family envelope stress response protein [Lachnospiraceae bacterium]